MAKFSHIANSFRAGRMGDQLVGRTDIEEYRYGCLEFKNMINGRVGGAFRRGGFAHLTDVTNTEGVPLKLIPFTLGLGEQYIVVLKGTADGLGAVPTPSVYDSEGNSLTVNVSLSFGSSDKVWFSNPSTARYAQFGKYLVICDSLGTVPPVFLYFHTDGQFYLKDYTVYGPGNPAGTEPSFPTGFRYPYLPNLSTDLVLKYNQDGAGAGLDTLSMQDSTGSSVNYFVDGAAAYFKVLFPTVESGDTEMIMRQIGFVSASEIIVAASETRFPIVNIPGTEPTDGDTTSDWSRAAWDYQFGWPRTVTTYQQRLVFGGNPNTPTKLWFSAIANPFIFMENKLFQDTDEPVNDVSGYGYFGPLDSLQAFSEEISSTRATAITWLGSQRTLHIGTDTIEYAIQSQGVVSVLDPPSILPQTFHGAKNVQPSRISRYSVFVGDDGRTIRDFAYSDNNGSHVSRDLSTLSPDLIYTNLRGGSYSNASYVDLDWQEANRTLWLVSNRGALFSFSFDETAGLKGWGVHEIGGNPEVQSVCVINDGDRTSLYIATKRTINGSDVYAIEKLTERVEDPKYVNGSQTVNYLDGGKFYTYGSPTATHAASWLEGEEIYALADGDIVGPLTVSSGTFTTPTAVSEISFGYKYTHKMTTMPLEAGAVIGSSQAQLKRVDQMFLDLYRASGSKISYGDTGYPLEYPSVPANESFTGRIRHEYDSTPDQKYFVTLEGDEPKPFGVLNITFRGVTND